MRRYIREKGITQKCSEMNGPHHEPLTISFNISAVQLKQRDFLERLKATLLKYPISKELIEFEITESVFINDSDHGIHLLNSIKELGIQVSLDDFGTGYSSLAYLRRLPIDTLKIDRTFVNDLSKNNVQESLFGSIIDIAQKLKLHVVAEGIETTEQYDIIRNCSCEYAQGYFFKKPMTASELSQYLKVMAFLQAGA